MLARPGSIHFLALSQTSPVLESWRWRWADGDQRASKHPRYIDAFSSFVGTEHQKGCDAQAAPPFTLVAAEAQPRHVELSSETGIVQPNPLTLYPDATHGRDIMEDPMLEEFATSLASS